METSPIEICTLAPAEWRAYRALRLEALRDSPQAFGSSYQDQLSRPDSFWRTRLEDAAKGQHTWLFFARAGQAWVGMTGAYHEEADDPGLATIVSVYVTPTARGQGISTRLMQAILDQLRQAGFRTAQLGVVLGQTAALHLYQGFGFKVVRTETNLMGDGLEHVEYLMERPI